MDHLEQQVTPNTAHQDATGFAEVTATIFAL